MSKARLTKALKKLNDRKVIYRMPKDLQNCEFCGAPVVRLEWLEDILMRKYETKGTKVHQCLKNCTRWILRGTKR